MVRVVVVGGGVNGIGTALALQRRLPECHITIVAKELTPNTTGDGAAGFWEPYLTGDTPDSKIIEWSGSTWKQLSEWYNNGEGKKRGVSLVSGTIINSTSASLPTWHNIVLGYTALTQDQYQQYGKHYRCGSRFTTFTVEPSKLLPGLLQEAKALGTRVEVRRISSLYDVADQADLIINCSGLGARDLVPDPYVFPIRGQVIRVRAPCLNNFFIDNSEETFAYIIPNQDTVVLGGTNQENNWNLEVDPADSRTIWANCTAHIPALKSAEVVKEWVGLRPYRSKGVRLQEDELKVGDRTVPVNDFASFVLLSFVISLLFCILYHLLLSSLWDVTFELAFCYVFIYPWSFGHFTNQPLPLSRYGGIFFYVKFTAFCGWQRVCHLQN